LLEIPLLTSLNSWLTLLPNVCRSAPTFNVR
jgi:hypothetical protein